MGKTKKRFKIWHGVLTLVLVFGMGVGFTMSSRVSAIGDTGREAREVEHQNPPAAAVGRNNRVRPVEGGSEDFSRGIDLGPNRASETPGTSSQPVPRFSGLNAPWWLNSNGPVEVPDDSIFHGLVDVRAGLINNDPNKIVLPGAPAPGPGPALAPAPAPGAGGPQLNIALALGTPVGSTVAQGSSPEVTKINFTASGGDITVTRIAITRGGLATESDIFTICLLEGTNALVLPDCAVINAGEAGMPTYTVSSLNWQIPNGQTKTLSVQAGVQNSATAGATFNLGIANSAHVTVAAGTVSGTATGNTFRVAAPAPAPPLTIALADTPAAGNVNPGKTAHVATKVQFTAPVGNPANVTAIVVTRSGTAADTFLRNVKIFDDSTGTQLGSVVNLAQGGVATFNLSPSWAVATGQTETLRIVTDVDASAVVGTNFQLGIAAGAVATNPILPLSGLPVNGYLFTVSPHVSVALAVGTPAASVVQAGTDVDVALVNFYAQPGNNVVLHDVTITLNGIANSTDVPSMALFDGATQVSGFRNAITMNDGSIIYPIVLDQTPLNPNDANQGLTISQGATKALKVRARIAAGANAQDTLSARIATAANVTATLGSYAGSPASVGGTFPVAGNTFTIAAAPLPDLRILSLVMSDATPDLGQVITLSGTVYNGGTADAPDSRGRFCLDNTNCLTNETGLIFQHGVGALPLANPTSPPLNTTWTATGGTHTIYYCVDVTPVVASFAPVAESDETNNCSATAQFNVTAPAPPIFGGGGGGGGGGGYVEARRAGGTSILGLDSVLNSDFFESSNDVSPLDYFFPKSAQAFTLVEIKNLDLLIARALISKQATREVNLPGPQFAALQTLVNTGTIDATEEPELNALAVSDILTSTEKTAIARLIPGARKTGAPKAGPAGVTVRGITLYNPVTIHDDLWVRGSGNPLHEPGNLVVNGRIVAYDGTLNVEGSILATGEIRSASGVNLGDVGAETQINGDFSVVGGTASLGTLNVAGPLTASNGGTISGQFNVLGPSSFGEVLLGTTTVNGPFTAGGVATFNGNTTLANVTISGTLTTNGNATFGAAATVGGALTASGAFTAAGNTTLAATTISGLLTANNSTIMNKDLTVYENAVFKKDIGVGGNLSAAAIGAFYRLEKSITTPNKAGPSSAEVSCGAGDILVSCSGSFSGEQFRGTTMTEAAGKIQKCKADGNQTSAAPKNLKVQAVCFDPNRNNSAPAGAVGL